MLNVNFNGNRKLKNNDKVRFAIWNLPAVSSCPFATEHCKKSCYALKAERIYPQTLPSRQKNYADSLRDDFTEKMITTIENALNSKKFNGKKMIFRIHESGDFYNLEYTEKWVNTCKRFENDNRVIFWAYTKSLIYFVNCGYGSENFPQNLTVRSSIWDDTSPENIQLTVDYKFPIYTALSDAEFKRKPDFFKCACVDCGKCQACGKNAAKNIACKIH
jgi:hypothetical protein